MKKSIAVFFGGVTTEHEVSIESAKNVIRNLCEMDLYEVYPFFISKDGRWFLTNIDIWNGIELKSDIYYNFSKNSFIFDGSEKHIDVCFSLIHGNIGEDGKLCGFFETVGLAYTGCGVLSSAIGMNKKFSKLSVAREGIKVVEDLFFDRREFSKDKILKWIENVGLPVFVKPNNLGSSVGVSKVKNIDELFNSIENAFKYDSEVLIEKAIDRARELVVGIIGDGFENYVSSVGEIVLKAKHEFYDYEAKYIDDDAVELKIPAEIDHDLELQLKRDAIKVFKTLGCYGFSRVDFLMDPKTNNVFFCEINTIPGFTSHSLFPRLFQSIGFDIKKQLKMIIELAFRRKEIQGILKRTI